MSAGEVTIQAVNQTPETAAFDLFLIGPGGSFEDLADHVAAEKARAEGGQPFAGPPPWADHVGGSDLIAVDRTETFSVALESGTYGFVCLWKFDDAFTDPVRPFAVAGPVEVGEGTAALCRTEDPGCEGPLEAGEHRSSAIALPFSYTVPGGWAKAFEDEGVVLIDRLPADGTLNSGADTPTAAYEPGGYILVVVDPLIARQEPCSRDPEPGGGRSPEDIVAWLTAHPGLAAGEPFADVMGGHATIGVDIAKIETWDPPCSEGVSLFVHELTEGLWWWIDDRSTERIFLVALPDNRVALVLFEALDAEFDEAVQAAMPVLRSIQFEG